MPRRRLISHCARSNLRKPLMRNGGSTDFAAKRSMVFKEVRLNWQTLRFSQRKPFDLLLDLPKDTEEWSYRDSNPKSHHAMVV